jgi:hypothetical protein
MKKLDFKVVHLGILAKKPWSLVSIMCAPSVSSKPDIFLPQPEPKCLSHSDLCWESAAVSCLWNFWLQELWVGLQESVDCTSLPLSAAFYKAHRIRLVIRYVWGQKFKVMNPVLKSTTSSYKEFPQAFMMTSRNSPRGGEMWFCWWCLLWASVVKAAAFLSRLELTPEHLCPWSLTSEREELKTPVVSSAHC